MELRDKNCVIAAELLDYDREEVKRVLLGFIEEKMKDRNIKEVLVKKLVKGVVSVNKTVDDTFLLCNKGPVNDMLLGKINKRVNRYVNTDGDTGMSVDSLRFIREEERMKIEIGLSGVDFDLLFGRILERMETAEKNKQGKNGAEEVRDLRAVFCRLLRELNGEIAEKEKVALLQMLLKWANENRVFARLADALCKEEGKLSERLGPLKLEVGEITVTL